MTPLETLNSLRESVEQMLSILDFRNEAAAFETYELRQFSEELLTCESHLTPKAIKPLELRFYSLLEQYPLLRRVSNAASHTVAVESCLHRLHYFDDLKKKRDLLPIEIEQRKAFEENLKLARQRLNEALEF